MCMQVSGSGAPLPANAAVAPDVPPSPPAQAVGTTATPTTFGGVVEAGGGIDKGSITQLQSALQAVVQQLQGALGSLHPNASLTVPGATAAPSAAAGTEGASLVQNLTRIAAVASQRAQAREVPNPSMTQAFAEQISSLAATIAPFAPTITPDESAAVMAEIDKANQTGSLDNASLRRVVAKIRSTT